ncbi:MAG: hypothetical protein Q8R92_03960 [Deltaproteobacteria bacterium]|nr:hypothetical protein [Deltaproteobacteria bacterium]
MTMAIRRTMVRDGMGWALVLILLGAVAAGCRGDDNKKRDTGFIAVHAEARAALAAFQANDTPQLTRALQRLGEVGEQPELLAMPDLVRSVSLSKGGRYLVLSFGESLGGSKLILLDAASGRPLLGIRGYGESFSADDRWLACLQHRYAMPEPDADVDSYEVLLLVDLGRVRGASPEDTRVFRSVVQDTEARLLGGKTEIIDGDRIRVTRPEPPLAAVYDFDGKPVSKKKRRWRYLKLF